MCFESVCASRETYLRSPHFKSAYPLITVASGKRTGARSLWAHHHATPTSLRVQPYCRGRSEGVAKGSVICSPLPGRAFHFKGTEIPNMVTYKKKTKAPMHSCTKYHLQSTQDCVTSSASNSGASLDQFQEGS